MAKLIYLAIASLDGYVNDEAGKFDWCVPDEAVHAFVNDLLRPLGTHLYGRRLYEVMTYWETAETGGELSRVEADFAQLWRAAAKVVFSKTLHAVSSARTRIERDFDVALVQALKAGADRDLSVGGAELAGQALSAGLVDELHLLLSPVIVGGGTPALPSYSRLALELTSERRFENGVVHLHYRVNGALT